MSTWEIYTGKKHQQPHDGIKRLPDPPPWRQFQAINQTRGQTFQASPEEVEMVNAALYLRRPLLITGKPGIGKSSLAYAVAEELQLGPVLRWSITTQSTLSDGLYDYDAIGRLQEANLLKLKHEDQAFTPDIGRYIRLGPLGTALYHSEYPRVLLIDEIDKSNLDLPNDLLHVFEEGEFIIPQLARLPDENRRVAVMTWDNQTVSIERGHVCCKAFPFVIFTSNGEREFPPAFLRRCLRLTMQPPSQQKLVDIVAAHLEQPAGTEDFLAHMQPLVDEFLRRREKDELATDQLLNAIYLATQQVNLLSRATLCDAVLRSLR